MALRPFHVLSLCSGIGGLDLGVSVATRHAARTVCYVEREGYCASVLQARMASGHLDDAPIWSDLKTFDPRPWRGKVDCITAGYPCQPFSAAGKRKGKEDPRHLWPYIKDIVATISPSIVFCENVTGHLALGFEEVCEDLSRMGYAIEAGIYSAEMVGAPHRRERLFFFAYATSTGQQTRRSDGLRTEQAQKQRPPACGGGQMSVADAHGKGQLQQDGAVSEVRRRAGHGSSAAMANTNDERRQQGRPKSAIHSGRDGDDSIGWGQIKSAMGLSANGPADLVDHIARGWPGDWEDGTPRTGINITHRTDRLRALGNAVVPAVAAKAWSTLSAMALGGN